MIETSLGHLEALVWIGRLGTFSAAAEHLNLSQPAVSFRIRQLEALAGATLFTRRGNSVCLSAEGSALLGHAESVLDAFDNLNAHIQAQGPWNGVLRLGSSGLFAMTCLPDILMELEAIHPGLNVELTSEASTSLFKKIQNGQLDAAFVSDPDQTQDFETEMLGFTPLALISNGRLELPAKVSPSDLQGQRIIINPPPSAIYKSLTRWFKQAQSRRPVLSTCNSLPVTLGLARSGAGIGVVPAIMVSADVEAGTLICHEPTQPLAGLQIALAYRRQTSSSIVDFLHECALKSMATHGFNNSDRQ